jgi:hypothetical protein
VNKLYYYILLFSAESQLEDIMYAMDLMEAETCIKFVPRDTEKAFVEIHSGNGCSSSIGRTGKPQRVSLNNRGCMRIGTIQHELIHALGYHHMHNHEARDNFVTVKFDNIKQPAIHNFDKVDRKFFDNFGTPYDINSVMHYPPKAFSNNGELTIVPKNPSKAKQMGQRIGMSNGDIKRLNNMYKCGARKQQAQPGYYQGDNQQGSFVPAYQEINNPDYTQGIDYRDAGYQQY